MLSLRISIPPKKVTRKKMTIDNELYAVSREALRFQSQSNEGQYYVELRMLQVNFWLDLKTITC